MTPRQFVLLGRIRHQQDLRQEFGPALVCVGLAALAGVKRTPWEFMPSMGGTKPTRKQKWQDQLELVKAMHARIGAGDGTEDS